MNIDIALVPFGLSRNIAGGGTPTDSPCHSALTNQALSRWDLHLYDGSRHADASVPLDRIHVQAQFAYIPDKTHLDLSKRR